MGASLRRTYSNSWAVLAHTAVEDDIEVAIGWIQESANDAENRKGLQIHSEHRHLGIKMKKIYLGTTIMACHLGRELSVGHKLML